MENKLDEILTNIGFVKKYDCRFEVTSFSIFINDVLNEDWFKKLVKLYNRNTEILEIVENCDTIKYSFIKNLSCVTITFLGLSSVIMESEFDCIFVDFIRDRKLNLILD